MMGTFSPAAVGDVLMPTVEIGATTLDCEEVGDGPPCLIAHGGPGVNHRLYRSLDPLGSARRLIYWDHRGHGRSAPLPPGDVEISLFADDAVALADRLGIESFALFGHSFGGWVAQEIAIRHPQRVSALVLAATTPGQPGSDESPEDDQGPPPPPEVADLLASRPRTDIDVVQAYTALAPHFLRTADTRDFLLALRDGPVSADSWRRVFDALGRWSSVDRLAMIDCPTLVLAGRHDVFCSPPQLVRIARRIRGAEQVVFENSGHFMWLEEPDAFFGLLGPWLRSH
jgi:proline iminopeptidase